MKKYTQRDIDGFPKSLGQKHCPKGDYTKVKHFQNCTFMDGCVFGINCTFDDCTFGAYQTFGVENKFISCTFGSNCAFEARSHFGSDSAFGNFCDFGDKSTFLRNCYFGHYCTFGVSCKFGTTAVFGNGSDFQYGCEFSWAIWGDGTEWGPDCKFDGVMAHKSTGGLSKPPVMKIVGAGSTARATYFFNTVEGIRVRSGCFTGSLQEFREKVRKVSEPGDLRTLQYLGFANIVAATWDPKQIEG